MKRWLSTLTALLISATMIIPSLAAADNLDDDSGKEREKAYHLFDQLDLAPTTDIRYAKPRVVARLLHPKVVLRDDDSNTPSEYDDGISAFNDAVETVLQDEYKQFRDTVATYQSTQESYPSGDINNDLRIDFDSSFIKANESPIISIRFSVRGYITGRTEPYRYHRVLNFDLDTGEPLELADLFTPNAPYLDVLSAYTAESLAKHLKNKNLIESGTAPKLENFRNWNLNPHGLLITFDSNQVAPAIYGTQTVLIPYSILKEILESDSPAAACLENRKKCLRNNVLTGGFIDMA